MNTEDHPHEMLQPLGLFAGDLFARGIEYRDAFEILTVKNTGKLLYASYFLLANSLELFLKSYLAACGTTKKAIRYYLGHDLPTILHSCEQRSIPDVPNLRVLVAKIHEMNKDHDFRYPSNYSLSLPTPAECLPIAHSLASAIAPMVEQAKIRAALHFASDTAHLRGKKVRWAD